MIRREFDKVCLSTWLVKYLRKLEGVVINFEYICKDRQENMVEIIYR